MSGRPQVIVLGGPNGAGKSTAASLLLPPEIEFVNADEVAKALPGYPFDEVDRQAARIVLKRLDDLERSRTDFAVETTLAGRGLVKRIGRLRDAGYRFRLIFLWTPSPEFSIRRVAARVRAGGHDIPEATIRRRYGAGLSNFFALHRPIADQWAVYDATTDSPRIVAEGRRGQTGQVLDPEIWNRIGKGVDDE